MLFTWAPRLPGTGRILLLSSSYCQTLKRMCVTYFCQSEICQPGGYWLVIANNRDEYWERPTKPAHFWGPGGSCFSAQDETPGKEGGTWLGVSTTGRLAVLVNILGQEDANKKGRGSLVSNFISSDIDIHEYAKTIESEREAYNGFNLVLFDLGKKEESLVCKPVYVSNASIYPSVVHKRSLPANAFIGLSNSTLEYPFKKVENGRARFGELVSRYPSVVQKPYLIDALFGMMADRTCCMPDMILERVCGSVGYSPLRIQQLSAINVYSPQFKYGSRTSTVLLIDNQGHIDYVEKNFDFSKNPETPATSINHQTFHLSLTDINHNALTDQ